MAAGRRTADAVAGRTAAAARELHSADDPAALLATVVELAVGYVAECDDAGITILHGRQVETVAASSDQVRTAGLLQRETGEGPSLDAIATEDLVHASDLGSDPRWTTWGPAVASQTALRSVVALRVHDTGDTLGALTLYARRVGAFAGEDRERVEALAAHVAVAVAAADQVAGLQAALATRGTIGQAIGILVERYEISAGQAWSLLVRISSTTETKLRVVAAHLVETRELPGLHRPQDQGPAHQVP